MSQRDESAAGDKGGGDGEEEPRAEARGAIGEGESGWRQSGRSVERPKKNMKLTQLLEMEDRAVSALIVEGIDRAYFG
jgi:hypothetical protein